MVVVVVIETVQWEWWRGEGEEVWTMNRLTRDDTIKNLTRENSFQARTETRYSVFPVQPTMSSIGNQPTLIPCLLQVITMQ